MAKIITLTGASGAGKSTAIDFFLSNQKEHFHPICIPKFTTRNPRKDDSKREVKYCQNLPNDCDLVYQQYDVRYGLSLEEIMTKLKKGLSPIIVLNDVRTIREVKRIFGELTVSCFVYRTEPKLEDFVKLAALRGQQNQEMIEKRFRKAQAIYRIYIENIYLFDHVLINSFNRKELKKQISQMIKGFQIGKNHYLK